MLITKEKRTIRTIYKVLKESKNITDMIAWMRRNYPEALRKED